MLRSLSANNQFAGFLVAGGLAALVNFLSRIGFNQLFGYATSIVLAYLVGMVTAFLLTRHHVFAPSGKSVRVEAAWFTLVNVLAVAQTLGISLLLADLVLPELGIVTYRKALAHAVGIAVPAVTSYFGHRYWTFAPQLRRRAASVSADQYAGFSQEGSQLGACIHEKARNDKR